jgi:superfamily II DNA or RNA helicase
MLTSTQSTQLTLFQQQFTPEPQPESVTGGLAKPSKQIITHLHPDQQRCVREIYSHIRNGVQTILLIAICGNGKTVMGGWIIKDATQKAKKPTRCLFLVPRITLLSQAQEEFESLGMESTILQSSRKFDREANVIIASVDTIGSRLKKQTIPEILGEGIGVIFHDEAHFTSYQKPAIALRNYYLSTGATIVGLTATPWRTKRAEYMGQYYEQVVVGQQAPDLIKAGRAVPSRIFILGGIFDLTAIDLGRDGDYRVDQVEEQGIKKAALDCVVREYRRLASNRIAIAFCATVHHAEKLAIAFRESGISADWITGETRESDRKEKFKALTEGEIQILVSVGTLNVGFNVRNISAVLFVRPTKSRSLWHQSVGRAARTYPGKTDYLILDFGNSKRQLDQFGSPSGYHNYDISEQVWKKDKEEKRNPATKECPECNEVISAFVRICPSCGHEFPKAETEEDGGESSDAELVEILLGLEKTKAKFLREQKRLCFKERLSPDVAVERFLKEFGHIPPDAWHAFAVLGKRPSKKKKREYLEYLESLAKSRYHQSWLRHHKKLEFGEVQQPIFKWVNEPWWAVLGVQSGAEHSEVKASYMELAKTYHPDVSDEPQALEHMQLINCAWEDYLQTKV